MGDANKNGLDRDEAATFLKPDVDNKDATKGPDETSFFRKLRQNDEFRHRIIHTAVVCWSFITLGWAAGMGGPTFPDIRQIVQKDLSTASWLFTVGAIGYVVGSLVFGILYDKLNKLLLLAVSTFFFGVFQCVKPWCTIYPVMLVVTFLTGLFCGGLDTGGNADIPYVWGVESGPYMQALHLCFCLGAIVSPLASEPFLAKKHCATSNNHTENTTALPLLAGFENVTDGTEPDCIEVYEDTEVHYAFLISAILIVTATFGYICLYCKMSHVHANLAKQQKESKEKALVNGLDQNGQHMSFKLKAIILTLLALLMMSYCVMEDGFASFLMTFSLSHLHWSKDTGSYATTVFWACFVTGRFLGIFLVGWCKQTTLLTTFFAFIAVSLVGFTLASVFSIIPLIWLFTGTIGFSMSIVFPCIFGWTSDNILKITGKISSMFLVSAGLGAMLFPILVGHLMEYHSPLWFAYLLVIVMGVTASLYATISFLTHFGINRKQQNKQGFEKGKELTTLKSKTVTVDKDHELYPVLR